MTRRNPFRIRHTIEYQEIGITESAAPIDFEESLMDMAEQERLERNAESAVSRLPVILTGLILAVLLGRLYYLTVTRHDFYLAAVDGNRLRVEYLAAPRGAVYDSRGEVIAASQPSFELVALPLDLPKDITARTEIAVQAANILGIEPVEITSVISDRQVQSFQSVLIKQNINKQEALIFQESEAQLPGFRVVNTPIRDYVRSPLAYAHLLGFVGKLSAQDYEEKSDEGYQFNDSIGKTGLELVYEDNLRGTFGERQVEVDARGVVKKIYGEKKAVPGQNLVLNIDAGLQDRLYDILRERLRGLGRRKAAAIAMDPRDGRVLAFISLPGFDNNLFAEGISQEDYSRLAGDRDQPLFNRAIAGTYPPGSTVKPMVSVAALEEKIVTPETIIRDDGQITITNPYGGPDSVFIGYGRKALGLMTVRKAIALSSDIFFYIVGGGFGPAKIDGLGIERIARYYRMFGLGQKLGIDLAGEQDGLVPDPAWKKDYFKDDEFSGRWYLGDTYHVSIGQGDLLVSPLHVLSWTATIANGGHVFRPFIVDRVEKDGEVVEKNEPQVIGEIRVSAGNIKTVQEGMREAVLSGTATSLQRLPISSAAKTGTAQFDARNRNRSHAWFTAYAPFENPEIAITVLIEDAGEGGVNSMPVVRDTLDWWAKNRYKQ